MFRYNTYVVKFSDDFQIDSFESVADFVKNSGILAELHALVAGEQLDALVKFSENFALQFPETPSGETLRPMAEHLPALYFTLMKKRIQLFLVTLLIVCLGLSHNAQAVTPAPDGGYPGGNTAEGDNALLSLSQDGTFNTAVGYLSLRGNTNGNFNTAIGAFALLSNTNSAEDTAIGTGALLNTAAPFVIGGNRDTADGAFALFYNTTGSSNTAIGDRALINSTTGSNNIALGDSAGSSVTTASNVICIGSPGGNAINNTCFIGNIFGSSVSGGAQVFINSVGRLGAPVSSQRFKEDIKPMKRASEVVFALKPVTFHYKKEIDPQEIPQFGLVAEEVEKVNPDLIVRDKEGKPYSVRYEQVNAMLLNEFLKEHQKVQELEKQVQKLTVGLQKVSAQVEASKAAPQVVNNP